MEVDRELAPCVGVCSASTFDDVCKGCKRSKEQIDNWIYFSKSEKREIMRGINNGNPNTSMANSYGQNPSNEKDNREG